MKRLGLLLFALSGCFVPRDSTPVDDRQCTRCHGDPAREGDATTKSAPPFDIFGNTEHAYPGVGAHQQHLLASASHAAVACTECHRVPSTAQDEGHNVGTTAFSFGPIALGDAGVPATYDFATRRCLNACHGTNPSGVWTDARDSAQACGSCHGLPPPAPHPQATQCFACHSAVVNADGGFVDPSLHVDGRLQLSNAACDTCHGHDQTGAPPRALDGGTQRSQVGVGAHALHLSGGAKTKAVACATCHDVPAMAATVKHPNGGRAEVLSSVRWSTTTTSCTNACHLTASPAWTDVVDGGLSCTGCHGTPPPAPHPQVADCAECHPNATGTLGRDLVDRQLHVNGTVELALPASCSGCHGSGDNFAPPRDTAGRTDTTLPSVGAHQAHVVGRGLARPVLCNECHVVPSMIQTATHLDGVAEVRFGGVATSNLAQPRYSGGTCGSTACHDISNFTSADGGGTATTPRWTLVDGSQSTCTSCHGMPPPLPHQQRSDCQTCHLNATASRTFVRPELHVNGHVDFQ